MTTDFPTTSTVAESAGSELIPLDKNPSGKKEADSEFSNPDRHHKHLTNRQFEQNILERKKYANYAYYLTLSWVLFLVAVVSAQMVCRFFGKGLDKEEFIAVVTTTTASVFGFWWLVGKYLFNGPDNPSH